MLKFGPFQLDSDRREFLRDGSVWPLQAKLFDTLVYLINHRDRVVEKKELLDSVWPDTFVAESTLFQTVSSLRKVLGCGKEGGVRYIATIPGRGYRFVADTELIASVEVHHPAVSQNGNAKHAPEPFSTGQEATPRQAKEYTPPRARAAKIDIVDTGAAVGLGRESPKPRHRRWPAATAVLCAAAAVLLGVSLWRSSGRTTTGPTNLTIRRLTSLEGVEWQPGFSPDGRSFAFSGTAFGSADIFVTATAGGDPLRRTFDPADDLHPRWSPDGRYIAFLSDRGAGASVYIVSPFDGPERRLTRTNLHRDVALLTGLGAQPWSRDSSSLLFPRRLSDGSVAVWKFDLASGAESQVTFPTASGEDLDASWSNRGDKIAFRGQREGRQGIWIVDANGQIEKQAADSGSWPAWSLDDRSLFVSSNRGGAGNIWRVELDSGDWFQITRGAGLDMYPAVAADNRLAYSSFQHTLHLYRTDLASGESQRLVAGTGRNLYARVSPDGTRIAYQSGRTGNNEIWLLNAETGQDVQFTHDPAADTRPDWSPDGREIVFRSARDGESKIWIADVTAGAVRCLSPHAIPVDRMRTAGIESNAAPRWSPDGTTIGYIAPSKDGFELWLASLGGKTEALPATRGVINFGWYRDAEHIIVSRIAEDGVREMLAMNLATGQQRMLHRGPHYELAVAHDGSAVSFSRNESHVNQNLYILRLSPPHPEDGLPSPLAEAEQLTDGNGVWHVHNGGWFPDGKSVVYTRDTDQADVFLVDLR